MQQLRYGKRNSLDLSLRVEMNEFKFDKYWLRNFWVIEVYLIYIITSDKIYMVSSD